jgi:hypothetical protein
MKLSFPFTVGRNGRAGVIARNCGKVSVAALIDQASHAGE